VCVFIGCVLGNTSHDFTGIMRVGLSSLFICFTPYLCVIFIHVVYGYLASEYLAFCLYNNSLIVQHQFTICGLFDFAYCVYIPCYGAVLP
jgi:hypothetical protein